jgi:hypothetical protein
MINDSQIKGLGKLVNSDVIGNIYPIVGEIEVSYSTLENLDVLHLDIYLNDSEANEENLWDKFQFDHHWLIDHHIRKLLPYLGINNDITLIRYTIYNTDFEMLETNDF